MKVLRPIFAMTLVLLAGVLSAPPAVAESADFYSTEQVTLLFSGTKVELSGECYELYPGELTAEFEFNADGTLSVEFECATSFQSHLGDDSGRWSVDDGRMCLKFKGGGIKRYFTTTDQCWPVKFGKYQFGLFSGRRAVWNLSVSHPKYPSKEDLMAALDGAAAAAQPQVAQATRSISDTAKDSAAWEEVKFSNRVSDFQRYLEQFPAGMFVKLAESQMRDLIRRQADPDAAKSQFAGIQFGNYHALVIGINDYKHLPKLKSAVTDAKSVASLLTKEYGFKVTLLVDPERVDIVDALDEYRESLAATDNLLIYYAGHGWLDEESNEGYWLTRSAKPNRRSRWISNATITNTLKVLAAKHVMVIADSCYSGTLTRSAAVGFRDEDYFKRMASKQARVALVSGGLEPVADDAGSGNSPFAEALLSALTNNDSVLDGTRLFSEIRRPVTLKAKQTPEYSDVRQAGHDGGDFLFVRKK